MANILHLQRTVADLDRILVILERMQERLNKESSEINSFYARRACGLFMSCMALGVIYAVLYGWS